MHEDDMGGLGLREAIELIRGDLLALRNADEPLGIRFPVTSLTVELKVVATNEGKGKAGFKVPFVGFEIGGELTNTSQSMSTVTVVLGQPEDVAGNPVKVSDDSSDLKG